MKVIWQCPECKRELRLSDKHTIIHCECGTTTNRATQIEGIQELPLPHRAWNYTKAMTRWMTAGCPARSKPEIEHILKTYCRSCKYYIDDTQTCGHKGCGCNLNDSSDGSLNKIAAATESCPIGLWLAQADVLFLATSKEQSGAMQLEVNQLVKTGKIARLVLVNQISQQTFFDLVARHQPKKIVDASSVVPQSLRENHHDIEFVQSI